MKRERRTLHEPPRKKGKRLQFRCREYMRHREKHVQTSLDKLFGVEKK